VKRCRASADKKGLVVCLGIVGRIVSLNPALPDLAEVDVAGLVRPINIGILEGESLAPGDFVLIHAGFAMEKIDAETARWQTAALRDYTGGPPDPDDECGPERERWPA
jgi:hydrogenase expression/formation protein HypC